MRKFWIHVLFAVSVLIAGAATAAPVANPELERRVARLSEELRCLVCQNQSLADSHAELAIDLRSQVREKLASGMSESDVIDFMVARYGDFVLYKPPVRPSTWLLWFGPFLLLMAAAAALVLQIVRRSSCADAAAPPPDELRRAAALLAHRDTEGRP